jgi:hypothetical protein
VFKVSGRNARQTLSVYGGGGGKMSVKTVKVNIGGLL